VKGVTGRDSSVMHFTINTLYLIRRKDENKKNPQLRLQINTQRVQREEFQIQSRRAKHCTKNFGVTRKILNSTCN
jgi:hypothetical protein